MKITLTVCNVCKRPDEPTRRYEIKSEGRRVSVDLCAGDSAALESFLEPLPSNETGGPQRGSRGRGRKSKVMTMEEIEALKKK